MKHIIDELVVAKAIEKLKQIYENKKGKSFILHIIRAFIPIYNSHMVKCFNEVPYRVCCLTGRRIVGYSEIEKYQKEKDKMKGPNESARTPIYVKTADVGYYSETSDRYLSIEGLIALNRFVKLSIDAKDPEISFVLAKIMLNRRDDLSPAQVNKIAKKVAYSDKNIENNFAEIDDFLKLEWAGDDPNIYDDED